jgi:hypothetical protein
VRPPEVLEEGRSVELVQLLVAESERWTEWLEEIIFCCTSSDTSILVEIIAEIARRDKLGLRRLESMELGKLMVFLGAMLVAAGVVVMLLGRMNVHLGRLPGDFLYRGKNSTVYFPLALRWW